MDHTCLVVPLLPGKEDELRAFYRDVEGPRQQDYDRSEQRLGITKEIAWRAPIDGGSAAVIYIESENFEQAFSQFVQSQDEFDLWFKQRVLDISGLDLNDPPEMELPDLLSVYQASRSRRNRIRGDSPPEDSSVGVRAPPGARRAPGQLTGPSPLRRQFSSFAASSFKGS